MEPSLSPTIQLTEWRDVVARTFDHIDGFLHFWPSDAFELGLGLLPFVLTLFVCLYKREWWASLAIVFLALIPPYVFYISGARTSSLNISYGSAVVWVLAFLTAVIVVSIVHRAHMQRKVVAQQAARIEELETSLFQERFWRKASGDNRSAIPSDEVIELAQWIQEPILEFKPAKEG